MANNSSGARSVLYGKTIDHVLEQTVALRMERLSHFREIPRARFPRATRSRPLVIGRCCASPRHTPPKSIAATRRSCAAWAATIWMNLSIAIEARESRQNHGGLGGHARRRAGSQIAAGAAAEVQGRDGDRVRAICSKRSLPPR